MDFHECDSCGVIVDGSCDYCYDHCDYCGELYEKGKACDCRCDRPDNQCIYCCKLYDNDEPCHRRCRNCEVVYDTTGVHKCEEEDDDYCDYCHKAGLCTEAGCENKRDYMSLNEMAHPSHKYNCACDNCVFTLKLLVEAVNERETLNILNEYDVKPITEGYAREEELRLSYIRYMLYEVW